jgi:O-antigen/teichoic acid export membrane protein
LQLIIGHFIYQIDVYLIYYLLGAEDVAFYSIAIGVATLLWFIPDTVGTVLFPSLASLKSKNEIHTITAKVSRNSLFGVTIGAIGLLLIGGYLIEYFYGHSYYSSIKPMVLILPGVIAMSGYKILTRDFSSRNQQQIPILAAFLSLAINIILNFIWIPKFGIEGAALASTVSYSFAVTILILFFKTESKLSLRDILIIRKDDLKFFVALFNSIFINRNKT